MRLQVTMSGKIIFAFASTAAYLISTLKPQCVCFAHDHTSAVSRKPTSRSKKVSYDAKLRITAIEQEQRQCLEHPFCKFAREVGIKQGKESVADELKREAERTFKRNVETVLTQSAIKDVQESGRSSRKASAPTECTRHTPPLYYHSALPSDKFFVALPSDKFFVHKESRLLAEGTKWSVREGKVGDKNVYIRCYELQGQNADALWESICQKTCNCAAYGYIYEDCLYAVFDSQVDVRVDERNSLAKCHSEIFAYFDMKGWEAGHSLVLQATDYDGQDCAVKVLENSSANRKEINNECRTMEALACLSEVPRIYGRTVCGRRGRGAPGRRHYIISEWVHGHPLNRTNNYHDHKGCGRILKALLQQISAMHKLGYAHRDIKPANIMNEMDGNIRVIDFGSASSQYVVDGYGTPGFIAPEVWGEKRVDAFTADVYSIAMTWHDIFFKCTPPQPDCPFSAKMAADGKLSMPGEFQKLDAAMEDLFYGMAHPDPKERISIDEALNHEYFKMLADL